MDRFRARRKKSTEKYFVTNELKDAMDVMEFIRNRLYFAVFNRTKPIEDTSDTHFFNTDETLVYVNFFHDFGPLNLGKLFRFCRMLHDKMKSQLHMNKKIVYWAGAKNNKKTNAAFLIGSFAVILLDMSPKESLSILNNSKTTYLPFTDANMTGISGIYTIKLGDCFNGINKACYFNLVNFADFDLNEYEKYEAGNIHSDGDLSWIVPQTLLAFAGPCGERNGNWPVESYLRYFKQQNVYTVVRLNRSQYDAKRFTNQGIDHFDLVFPDGTVPPEDILDDFLEIVENSVGATAVHCKAGLGRSGCLIGYYLMKHYRMTSAEAIAWMRICRPGCVIGQQQIWLDTKQRWAWKQGDQYREKRYGSSEKVRQCKYGVYSIKGKGRRISPMSDAQKKEKFQKIRERIKKRSFNRGFVPGSQGKTQGDLLIAARNLHVNHTMHK